MALIPIENVGQFGVIVDVPGYALPPEAWSSALNIRFDDGLAKKFLGHSEVYISPTNPPFDVKEWFDGSQTYWIVEGNEKIERSLNGTYENITRQSTVNIVSATATNPSVITVDAAYDFSDGETITIANETTATPALDGDHVATVITSTTFSIPVNVTVAGSDGDVTGDDDYTGGTWPIWSGGSFHGVPILNHNNLTDYPQQWDSTAEKMKDLDNWPANYYASIMVFYKTYLVALDVTKAGTRYPFLVKWSHPADPGAVPNSWDETDPTTDAGEATLGDSRGILVDAKPLANSLIIYKEDAAYSMTISNSSFIFRFDKVQASVGLFAVGCAQEYFRKHFVVTQDDIVLFNGSQTESIIDKKMRKYFFSNVDSEFAAKTFVFPNYPQKEMWICFVETGNPTGKINKALVWNWTDNTWTVRDLPEIHRAAYGKITEVSVLGGESFDSSSGVAFDADTGAFGSRDPQPVEQNPLMCSSNNGNQLLRGDISNTFDGTPFSSHLERTGMTIIGRDRFGAPKLDQTRVKQINAIWPKIVADPNAIIKISCGSQEKPKDAIEWEGPYDFDPAVDEFVNFTTAGKYIAVRFEEENGLYWEMDSYQLELEILGMY
jgi:hypothetical protein